MPWVPLLQSHTKSVDIFIHLLNKGNGLNNWFILPVHISGTLVSGEAMTKTELGSSHIIILNLLHDFDKMGSDSSVKLSDGVVVSGSESSSSKNSKQYWGKTETYSCPIFGSAIPSKNFCFLALLVAGKWVVKNYLSVLETLFAAISWMFSRASSAVVNGW